MKQIPKERGERKEMRKRTIAFAVLMLLLSISLLPTLQIPTARAVTSVYKDYTCSQISFKWKILGLLFAESYVKNIRVRVYSDKEINIVGDVEGTWPAIETCAFIQFLTADHADVTINSWTWNGLWKQQHIYPDYTLKYHLTFPGASLVGWGGGSGHFDVTLKPSTTEDFFGLSIGVNNLGAGIGMLADLYKLALASPDTLSFAAEIGKAVLKGKTIAENLGFVFHVADKWPTTTETVSTPGSEGTEVLNKEYAVYYDERYPTGWISRTEAIKFRDYLTPLGFVALNADDLKDFMQNKGKHSVVVMAQDIAPDTVADTKSSGAIIRQYLDRGGRVVWMEDVPFYYQGHADGTKTTWGTSGEHNIIGVWEGTWNLGQTVQIKTEGVNRGLTQTWVTQRESDDATVDYILADEDNNDAAGYIKSFNNGGEFIRIWDNSGDFTSDSYLKDLATVATTGSLSWQVEMTAHNADYIYARCGDININGYTKRIISWIDPGGITTVTRTVPGYWFNYQFDTVNAWVTTVDQYDSGKSWVTVKLTTPTGFKIQYYKMKPANLDHKGYFEVEMTGLWHVTTYRSHTPPTALAYNLPTNHNYDTGSRTKGAFMFTADLKAYASATLEFYHCYWTESWSSSAYDILRVQISTDYGESWTTLEQWDSRDPNVETWTQVTLDISTYAGNFVQLRFYFDSVDSAFNNYEGWYIDDIAVLAPMQYTLSIQAGYGGTTSPSPGSYTYNPGTSVTVTATATVTDYTFYYWLLDGINVGNQNPYTITMDSDHVLKAYFSYTGCVAEGTLITMADGSTKPVEKIKIGDQVLGFDPATGSYMAENVLDTIKHQVEVIVNINYGRLRLTPFEQPIYIRNSTYEGWIRDPANIQVGWEIYEAQTNGWVPVSSVTYEEGKTRVYDMVLDGYTTYIANGILVMDKDGC